MDNRDLEGNIATGQADSTEPGLRRQPSEGIFQGPLGLRAGWGIALFLLLATLLGVGLFVGLMQASGQMQGFEQQSRAAKAARARGETPAPAPLRPKSAFVVEAVQAGAVVLAAVALSFVERRRFGVYGLALRRLRDVAPGALWGLVSITLLVALLRGLHLLVFDRRLLQGGAVVRYGAWWLATFFLVGLAEEFLFRGYLQFTLMRGLLGLSSRWSPAHVRRLAFWMAALVWSCVFSLAHLPNAGEDPFGLVMVFVAGVLFSYALWRTGSLWWGIGFHLTWDWGQSFLYGVPDSGGLSAGRLFQTHAVGRPLLSGGSTGPEGSVLALAVLLLSLLAVRLHPAAAQPPVEPEASPWNPATETGVHFP